MPGMSFRRYARAMSGLALVAVLAAACSSSATPVPAGPTQAAATTAATEGVNPTTAATGQSNTPPLIGVFVTSLGQVLESGNGKVLYVHAGDTATTSTCVDACAAAWPPLAIAPGATIVAPPGAKGPYGSITRSDGSLQVTYRSKPLYFFNGDKNSGDTTGQGVAGFTVATP